MSLEQYRQPWESDEHWALRKEFLERYRDEFEEDRLLCLAQVYTNMELLQCSYPEEVEQEVRELSLNLALSRELREGRRDKNAIHFVKSSDNDEPSDPPRKKFKFPQQMFLPSSLGTLQNEEIAPSGGSLQTSELEHVSREESNVLSMDVQSTIDSKSSKFPVKVPDPSSSSRIADQPYYDDAKIKELQIALQDMCDYMKSDFGNRTDYQKCLNVVSGRLKLAPIQYEHKILSENDSSEAGKIYSCFMKIREVIVANGTGKKKSEAQAHSAEQAYKLFMSKYVHIVVNDSRRLCLEPSMCQVVSDADLAAIRLMKKRKRENQTEDKQLKSEKLSLQTVVQVPTMQTLSSVPHPIQTNCELPESAKITYMVRNAEQLFPVSHTDPAFVLFDNTKINRSEHAGNMLTESASFSHIPFTIQCENLSQGTEKCHSCEIFVNNTLACKAIANTKQEAKKAACDVLLDFFKSNCFTIKAKNLLLERNSGGFFISREKLMSTTRVTDFSLSEDNVGCKMLKMMGWSGGGIGRDESGIVEPIKADINHGRGQGLGFSGSTNQGLLSRVESLLQQYISSNATTDLIFSAEFSKEERNKIHKKAQTMGLKHSSTKGPNNERQLVIGRKFTMKELFHMLRQNGPLEKYLLIPPTQ